MKNVKIFAKTVDGKTLNHIYEFARDYSDCVIRVMPDCHDGIGSVIGTTIRLNPDNLYLNPEVVGVDIGCGVYFVELDVNGLTISDFEKLDQVIREYVPSGKNIHDKPVEDFPKLKELLCKKHVNLDRGYLSLGTLGGGNHFIEIGRSKEGKYALIIHSGSRRIGYEVAKYYSDPKNNRDELEKYEKKVKETIEKLKKEGRQREIADTLRELKKEKPNTKFLRGATLEAYFHDMKIMQEYARRNRELMAEIIMSHMNWKPIKAFHSTHNYIDFRRMIVRKGAISAEKGEDVVIPLNMRDGTIVGIGKGVEDWNWSAPHGAGRVMGRREAKEKLDIEEYRDTMKGIFTTSVSESTIDEAPMVYKPAEEILEMVQDTIEVTDVFKPVYNFKAAE